MFDQYIRITFFIVIDFELLFLIGPRYRSDPSKPQPKSLISQHVSCIVPKKTSTAKSDLQNSTASQGDYMPQDSFLKQCQQVVVTLSERSESNGYKLYLTQSLQLIHPYNPTIREILRLQRLPPFPLRMTKWRN